MNRTDTDTTIQRTRALACSHVYRGITDYSPRIINNTDRYGNRRCITITPTRDELVSFITVTDMGNNPKQAVSDATDKLRSSLTNVINSSITSMFDSFTGGSAGKTNAPLSWATIRKAVEKLSARGSLFCVLHPKQWAQLVNASVDNPQPHLLKEPKTVAEETYYVCESIKNVVFLVSPNVLVNKDSTAFGAIFVHDAIALDMRQPLAVEVLKDNPLGTTAISASVGYGVACVHPEFGITIVSHVRLPA